MFSSRSEQPASKIDDDAAGVIRNDTFSDALQRFFRACVSQYSLQSSAFDESNQAVCPKKNPCIFVNTSK